MATRSATRGKAAAKRKGSASLSPAGVICIDAPVSIKRQVEQNSSFKSTVIDLKKTTNSASKSELEEILKKYLKSRVGFVVLNAPFKLRPAKTTP